MKRLLIISTIIISFSACRYFGPVDGIVMKNIKSKPLSNELIGTWEVDSFSYNLIREEYENFDKSVQLIIDDSGKLTAYNLPDMVSDGFGRSINGEYFDCIGGWELDSLNSSWNLSVKYEPCELYKKGTWTTYDLYRFKGDLVIWVFLGDPDEARRLMFKKIQ